MYWITNYKYTEFDGDVHLSCFGPEISFIKNTLFKVKIETYSNSNMFNSMLMFIYSSFDGKYPFRVHLVQKIIIVCLRWSLMLSIFNYAESDSDAQVLYFGSEIPFLSKFGRNYQNCLFLPSLGHEISFLAKFLPKNQNRQLKK